MPRRKEVAVKKDDTLPADIADLIYADIGSGLENMTADDFAIPRLAILQSNSPQVDKRGEGYIEGAEPSMIIENVSNGTFDGEKGIVVVPISYRRTIIEWGLRENGGGFVADHGYNPSLLKELKPVVVKEKTYMLNDKGNQLIDTAEYFVYIVDGDTWSPSVISMSSTQMRKSKRWNTLIDSVKLTAPDGRRVSAAAYFMSYKLTTVPESNEKGSWFGWDIKKNGKTIDLEFGKNIYLEAREFNNQIKSGDVKVADPVAESGTTVESEDSPM